MKTATTAFQRYFDFVFHQPNTGNIRNIKRYLSFVICHLSFLTLLLTGCNQPAAISSSPDSGSITAIQATVTIPYTDALGREVELPFCPEKTVSLLGSFAELWELAGGSLVGITSDALEENRIKHSHEAQLLGTNKEPNLELLLALEPDLVLLSADIAGQQELDEQLNIAGIAHCYLKIEEFEDYLAALKLCTSLTNRNDLYEQNGLAVGEEIAAIRAKIAGSDRIHPLVLLIRAMSTGAKGKADDLMAGKMLSELGAEHLVNRYPSLLDELSLETILQDDPEFIFVLTMGDSDKALQALQKQMQDNPAWQELSAVREEKYIVLPKELFHFKPNARWGEAYAYLTEILYPGLFP